MTEHQQTNRQVRHELVHRVLSVRLTASAANHWYGAPMTSTPESWDHETIIRLVNDSKKRFLDLLLLADEQENMIDCYLERGDLFVMYEDGSPVTVCVVTDEGDGVFEVQNLAVRPDRQRHGYGQQMLRHVEAHYRGRARSLLVGTGDSPMTVPFYEACGFVFDHRVPRGIADAYDHPIIEAGVQLIDKVYLRKAMDSAPAGPHEPGDAA